jgi:copper chaperone CopZ
MELEDLMVIDNNMGSRIYLCLLTGLMLISGLMLFSGQVSAAEKKYINTTIQGLTCPYCISMLIKKVAELPGIEEVRINADNNRLLIVMKPNKSPNLELIKNTINNSGYLVKVTNQTSETTAVEKSTSKMASAHLDLKSKPCASCHNK